MLEIELPLSLDEVRDVLLETARQNAMAELQNAYLRIVVTRGTGPMGVSSVRDTTRPTVVVLAKDASGGDPRHPSPRSAVLCSYIRHPATLDPRIKSLNYLVSVMAYIEAERHGADIGVIRDAAGFVAEGHVMNLFCIRGAMVCTPAEGTSLAGITRGHVLQIAHEHGYACEERALTPYDFVTADEVFGTSASAGMFPISSFEGASFPAPGPITKALTGAYVDHALATATPVMPRIALQ
jgi:branched-chain amino acid aminotransferase